MKYVFVQNKTNYKNIKYRKNTNQLIRMKYVNINMI
jgi:hypothetical protein